MASRYNLQSYAPLYLYSYFFAAHKGYYDGATELYEYGWAKSFHFSRFYKGEAFAASLARHEHYLAAQMSLRPGMKVLDVGCGVGGPAREIARFADVTIVGLNNNDFQIQRGRKYTKEAGLEDQVSFVKGDFMKLVEQFGENAFDAGTAFFTSGHLEADLDVFFVQFTPLRQPSMRRHGKASMSKSEGSSSLEEQ
jgi:cyclopropane fatty-acyl-phospholipid synthase-like methyltransferase